MNAYCPKAFIPFAAGLTVAACASPQKLPTPAPLQSRCDLVATVLTYPPPGSDSAIESSWFAAARDDDGSFRVLVTTGEKGQSFFAVGEGCGPRIKLADMQNPQGAASLSLMPRSPSVYLFELKSNAQTLPQPAMIEGQISQDNFGQWTIDAPKRQRAVDAAPRRSSGNEKIEAGKISVLLRFDTGCDVMASSKQAGLVLVVRYDDQQIEQTIASCDEPVKGNALPPASPTAIDTAYCGDAYGIEFAPGLLTVQRHANGNSTEVTRISVPKDLVIR